MGIKSLDTGFTFKKLGKQLGNLIYPNVCLHCEGIGEDGLDLCRRCYAGLPCIAHACQRCALPLVSADAKICGACSKRDLCFDRAFAAFQFEGFVQDALYQFKFNQKLNYGKLLANLLIREVDNKDIEIPEIFIPVPLHKNRIRKRGYNQALEIARILCKHYHCTLDYKCVYRNRDTGVQMDLPAKKRAKNVKDAFSVRKDISHLKNKHICILDDVMTTGNTVNEVAKCLNQVGVGKIDVWCVARVC